LLEPAPFGLSIGSLVEEYLADCRRRGLSPKTVDYAYGYPLRHVFLPWCSRVGIGDPGRLPIETAGFKILEENRTDGSAADLVFVERIPLDAHFSFCAPRDLAVRGSVLVVENPG